MLRVPKPGAEPRSPAYDWDASLNYIVDKYGFSEDDSEDLETFLMGDDDDGVMGFGKRWGYWSSQYFDLDYKELIEAAKDEGEIDNVITMLEAFQTEFSVDGSTSFSNF